MLDNYATHKTPAVRRWLARNPGFTLHFTPTSGSWLNMVESFFAELTTKQCAAPPSPRSNSSPPPHLDRRLERQPPALVWTKTADQILGSVANYCRRINDSRHQ